MITIIHGDDISASRKYFQDLKAKQKNIVSFDGGKITITDLVQNIEGSSLFGDTKSIFVEELFAKLKKSEKSTKEILNFIAQNSKDSNFVLWESKEILKRDLSLFKNPTVHIFKLPKNIFLFLDNLRPGNYKSLLNLFHQALEIGIKEEIILFMMQRQIRLLIALTTHSNNPIDEVLRLAPWQKSKLEKQAMLFSEPKLKQIYKKLYEIELAQKTGGLPLSLTQAIDFLLFEI